MTDVLTQAAEALREIARQHTQDEFDDDELEHGDLPGAYDTIIGVARKALAAIAAEQSRVPEDRERLAQELIEAAQACWPSPSHRLQIAIEKSAAALRTTPADGWRAVAEATREEAAKIAREHGIGHNAGPYAAGWIECAERITEDIRAMPLPSSPEETKP